MRKVLILFTILFCFMSCKTTKYVDRDVVTEVQTEVPITNTQIQYKDRTVHDSIYFHDSIYTYIKGDTVIQYKEKFQTRYLTKTDTVVKKDTVQVPVTVTNTVTKTETQVKEVNKLYWWQKTLMYIGLALLISGIVYLILKLKKYL